MSQSAMNIPGIKFTESGNFLLIAGPCVVESEEIVFETAEHLVELSEKYNIPLFSNHHTEKQTDRGEIHFQALEILKLLRSLQKCGKGFPFRL